MIRKTDDVIIKTVARIFIPFIQIYALYVIMHGHYSPGGGFQGGVILGASIVLLFLTHGLSSKRSKIVTGTGIKILSSVGVLIYGGIGFTCILLAGNFLDYSKFSKVLNMTPSAARSFGILAVELGVALTVMSVMVSIFVTISTTTKDSDEGE